MTQKIQRGGLNGTAPQLHYSVVTYATAPDFCALSLKEASLQADAFGKTVENIAKIKVMAQRRKVSC